MALIGINPTDFKPRKRTALDSIAIGADIAAKVLGGAAAGAGAYNELFGPKANALNAAAEKDRAEAKRVKLDKATNPLLEPAIKGLSDQKLLVTTDLDPDKSKFATYLPGYNDAQGQPVPVWVKHAPEDPKEALKTGRELSNDFNQLQEVKDFKDFHNAAQVAAVVSAKEQPKRPDDLALLSSLIKMQQPSARFRGEAIEGLDAQLSPVTDQAVKMWHKLWDPNNRNGLLAPEERQFVVDTISSQYGVARESYDRAWKDFLGNAAQNRARVSLTPYPEIKFPKNLATKKAVTTPSIDSGALQNLDMKLTPPNRRQQ